MRHFFVEKKNYTGTDVRRKNRRVFGFVGIILCLIGLFFAKTGKKEEITIEGADGGIDYQYIASLVSDGSGPESGTVFFRKYKTNPAVLHIWNKATLDACIQCSDGLLNKSVVQFYIRAGEEADIEVPVGYFELHVAMGETWMNEDNLFGENTLFFSDLSKYGQEFNRKKICEFAIEESLNNLRPITKEKY